MFTPRRSITRRYADQECVDVKTGKEGLLSRISLGRHRLYLRLGDRTDARAAASATLSGCGLSLQPSSAASPSSVTGAKQLCSRPSPTSCDSNASWPPTFQLYSDCAKCSECFCMVLSSCHGSMQDPSPALMAHVGTSCES